MERMDMNVPTTVEVTVLDDFQCNKQTGHCDRGV